MLAEQFFRLRYMARHHVLLASLLASGGAVVCWRSIYPAVARDYRPRDGLPICWSGELWMAFDKLNTADTWTGDAKDREILLADGGVLFDIYARCGSHHPLHGVDLTEYMGHMGWDRRLWILPWHRRHKLPGGAEYEPRLTLYFGHDADLNSRSCLRRS